MAKFNIEKAVEKTKFVLEKRQLDKGVVAQVAVALDVSGSAQDLFYKGHMQSAFQTVLPIGITFDANEEIDVYTFSSGDMIYHIEPTANKDNYESYVKTRILDDGRVRKWSGTDYAPVLNEILDNFGFKSKGLFGFGSGLKKDSSDGHPVIIYFLTDGENYDQPKTETLIAEMQSKKVNAYIQFVGIGGLPFTFIKNMADRYDNVGFTAATDLAKFVDDDSIYDSLLPEELVKWLKNA